MANDLTYCRAVLDIHVADVVAKLLAVKVAFSYVPLPSWCEVVVDAKHAATLAACIDQITQRRIDSATSP